MIKLGHEMMMRFSRVKAAPMLKALPSAICLLLVAVFANAPARAQWIEFRPEGIGYVVEMPGKWTFKVGEINTSIGTIKTYQALVEVGGVAYMSMYIIYPEEGVRGRALDSILDGARDGGVANVKGKLRSEDRITVSNTPARQVIIDAPGNIVVVTRFLMLGNTLIQALTAGQASVDFENKPDTKRFLASLRILPR